MLHTMIKYLPSAKGMEYNYIARLITLTPRGFVRTPCSSSSGSRTSSRRRSSGHSKSRSARGGFALGTPLYGKHSGGGGNGSMLGVGGGIGMGMGGGMGGMTMGMAMGGVGMSGMGMAMGGKDYASMASPPKDATSYPTFPLRTMGSSSAMMGGNNRHFASSPPHHAIANGSMIARPVPAVAAGKDYASLASGVAPGGGGGVGGGRSGVGGGGNGGGSVADRRSSGVGGGAGGGGYGDQARDVRNAGRMLGAAISGRVSEVSLARGSGGGGGRFDRLAGKTPPSPPPPGRDQFGRERDWRGSVPNGRRTAASPPNGQVRGIGTDGMICGNVHGTIVFEALWCSSMEIVVLFDVLQVGLQLRTCYVGGKIGLWYRGRRGRIGLRPCRYFARRENRTNRTAELWEYREQ